MILPWLSIVLVLAIAMTAYQVWLALGGLVLATRGGQVSVDMKAGIVAIVLWLSWVILRANGAA